MFITIPTIFSLVAFALHPLTTRQQTLAPSVPAWGSSSGSPTSSYITDDVSHITSIVVNFIDYIVAGFNLGPYLFSLEFHKDAGSAVGPAVPAANSCTLNG